MDKPNELSEKFNKSAQPQPPKPIPPPPPSVQSEHVKKQKHGLHDGPKPPGGTSKAGQHNQDRAKDNVNSKKATEEYKEKLKQYNKKTIEQKEKKKSRSNEVNKSTKSSKSLNAANDNNTKSKMASSEKKEKLKQYNKETKKKHKGKSLTREFNKKSNR